MRTLLGNPVNISAEIVGKITIQGKNVFTRKSYIYVTNDINNLPSGYFAILTSKNINKGDNIVSNIVNLDGLFENDVVHIAANGQVTVLFEIQSSHNAIIATERCNCNCIMCPQPRVLEEPDKTNFNLKLISLFDKNTKNVSITGGEPTLIGDNLFKIIYQIKRKLPKSSISLLSNGIKFSDFDYAKRLALINHFDLQIDIPIYSDIDSEHNRIVGAKAFYKTIEGLYNLAKLNQKIGLRFVIHKQTFKRLPQLAEYIYRNFPFVCHVAFMQMETTGLASHNIKELWIDPVDYNFELEESVLNLARRNINVSIYNSQFCILPRSLWSFARQSISSWKKIFIEECNHCEVKDKCAGFFVSSETLHSKYIKSIKKDLKELN